MFFRKINQKTDNVLQPVVEKVFNTKIADKPAPRTGYRWLRGDLKLLGAAAISIARGEPSALFEIINVGLGQYDNGAHIKLADGRTHKVNIKENDSAGLKWRKKNFDLISYAGLASKGIAFTGMGIAKFMAGNPGGASLTFTGASLFTGSLFLAFRAPIDEFLQKKNQKQV